jgi:hypothetical protein
MGPVWDKKRFIFKGKMAVASAAAVFDKSSNYNLSFFDCRASLSLSLFSVLYIVSLPA